MPGLLLHNHTFTFTPSFNCWMHYNVNFIFTLSCWLLNAFFLCLYCPAAHQQHLLYLVDCWMHYSFVSSLAAHLQFALQAKLETYRVMIFQRLASLFWGQVGWYSKTIDSNPQWSWLGKPWTAWQNCCMFGHNESISRAMRRQREKDSASEHTLCGEAELLWTFWGLFSCLRWGSATTAAVMSVRESRHEQRDCCEGWWEMLSWWFKGAPKDDGNGSVQENRQCDWQPKKSRIMWQRR